MLSDLTESPWLATPAFIYAESMLASLSERVRTAVAGTGARVLYALKPFSFAPALDLMAPRLDGFAASSLYEARLARETLGVGGSLHITSPGLRADELPEIASICDYIAFNSLSQWERYSGEASRSASCGLRVNPQLSVVGDARYDPCRPHSKLGVPLEGLVDVLDVAPATVDGIRGIHFHTNCDSEDYGGLLATAELIAARLDNLLRRIDWVNLGGGYLFGAEGHPPEELRSAINVFTSRGLRVFMEPGAGLIREAGFIVSSVVDVFDSGGRTVAILDTSVNHMPEVFEYGFEPDVVGHEDGAPFSYILAGATCLAGDVFGDYSFAAPLAVGDRVAFKNAGAYTLTKAHMFNGVDLPVVYALTESGELQLKKEFGYRTFADRWKADAHALA